jgi:hypothetical protein
MSSHNPELLNLLNVLAFPPDQASYTAADRALQNGLKQPGPSSLVPNRLTANTSLQPLTGVYGQLQAIASTPSLSREIRLLSSILVGRELPKKWRAKQIIPDHLKPEIRERFFTFFQEQDGQIARAQLRCLVLVARQDYPRSWQSLPTDLLGPLRSSFEYVSTHEGGPGDGERNKQKTVLLNSLWTWNAFVKEWRGVKLPVGQQLMIQVNRASLPLPFTCLFYMADDRGY